MSRPAIHRDSPLHEQLTHYRRFNHQHLGLLRTLGARLEGSEAAFVRSIVERYEKRGCGWMVVSQAEADRLLAIPSPWPAISASR